MADELDNTEEEDTTPNPLDMTDEQFAAFDIDSIPADEPVTEEDSDDASEHENEEEDQKEEEEENEEVAEDTSDDAAPFKGETETEDGDEAKDENTTDNTSEAETSESDEDTVDYESQVKELLSPFRANGKDMQVKSIKDARTLMQQGANYAKKMAGLKPSLRIIKMLDNNDLLDEDKLSFLIDLDKKDPAAIQKYIKDSGVDPLDIDVKKDSAYKPNTYTVDDGAVELDSVLTDLRSESKNYQATMNVIVNKWDAHSKETLAKNPGIIINIDEHISNGMYDKIQSVMDSERMLGRLNGVSDIAAYEKIGNAMASQGLFESGDTTKTNNTKDTKAPVKKPVDTKLKDRKRSASTTKGKAVKKAVQKEFNPLDMPDDEFEKLTASKYM